MGQPTNARGRALAAQQEHIERNVAQIEASKPRVSPLVALASRLNVEPKTLVSTLRNTVFKNASDDEFVALVIVANEYGLNPLTKEMYAFPQKGGGIVPLVSVDGWIRIMNSHPEFDGIEFTDIADAGGELLAIEAVIYRKDRTRPIRVTEYLDECKGTTGPWTKSPARMLRHRALIQCARVAFGFSGIYDENEAEVGEIRLAGNFDAPPMRQAPPALTQGGEDQSERFDADTGESLDSQQQDDRVYDSHTGMEVDARGDAADRIIDRIKGRASDFAIDNILRECAEEIDAMPEEMAGAIHRAARDRKEALANGGGK